jgi:hypothetical protein
MEKRLCTCALSSTLCGQKGHVRDRQSPKSNNVWQKSEKQKSKHICKK